MGSSLRGPIWDGFCLLLQPIGGQSRTPPTSLDFDARDTRKVGAIGSWNKLSFLLGVTGHPSANFEIRGAGSGHWKHQRHRDDCSCRRHRYCTAPCDLWPYHDIKCDVFNIGYGVRHMTSYGRLGHFRIDYRMPLCILISMSGALWHTIFNM